MQKQQQTRNQRRANEREFDKDDDNPRTLVGFGLFCGLLIGVAGFNNGMDGTTDNIVSANATSSSQPTVD